MRITKTMRPVVEYAQNLGYDIGATRKGHFRFTKAGRRTVITSATPSDRRSYLNALATIRKSEEGRL